MDVGLSVGVDGGSWRDTEMVVPLGWLSDTVGVNGYITGPAMVDGSAPKTYVFEAHSDLAIDVDARLVEGVMARVRIYPHRTGRSRKCSLVPLVVGRRTGLRAEPATAPHRLGLRQ